MTLSEIRAEIDRLDGDIASLLDKRLECSRLIGEYKRKTGAPIRDAAREEEIKKRVCALAMVENAAAISEIYDTILKTSREKQI